VGMQNPSSVAAAVAEGSGVTVDLGAVTVDHEPTRWFIDTASLGGYPDMVRLRDKWAGRWGRWPAAAAALVRVLSESTPLHVEINGVPQRVWVLFVGSGLYRPRGFLPAWRPRMDNGMLDVRYVRADGRFSRLRFVLTALSGSLHRGRAYIQADYRELDVTVRGQPTSVALDGEVGPAGHRFAFASHADALHLYRPAERP
jgi:diacylglycerol kinase family enzyme